MSSTVNFRRYFYAGLVVDSEVEVPEWELFEQPIPGGCADVTIRLSDVPVEPGQGAEMTHSFTENECRIAVPEVGCFEIRNGCGIHVIPHQGVPPRRLRQWLIGSAWGALCYQRGLFLFHGSAVTAHNEAVLFCARAKGGKSTLAANLNKRAYTLLSDDLCHVDMSTDSIPAVYPSSPHIKLWADAISGLGLDTEDMKPDPTRAGKFHVPLFRNALVNPVPIRAIYLLEWGELGIEPLTGISALSSFLPAATYRARLLQDPRQLGRHTERIIALLQRVPVWVLRRPRDLGTLNSVEEMLVSHWQSHRIMAP